MTISEKMACKNVLGILLIITLSTVKSDDLDDFISDDEEMMIAQESRQYQTIVKPPVKIIKPTGVTNSHRPQFNVDSYEEGLIKEDLDKLVETTKKTLVKEYKSSAKLRSKDLMIRDAVLRALERRDHVGKFAQVLPIIRAMSSNQRVALASLVASQVTTPPGKAPLNLSQVRSMFGNNQNSSADLMLPILLDTANLIRKAIRPGKAIREVKQPQILRRSFTEDNTNIQDEPDTDNDTETTLAPKTTLQNILRNRRRIPLSNNINKTKNNTTKTDKQDNKTATKDFEYDNTKENSHNVSDAENKNLTVLPITRSTGEKMVIKEELPSQKDNGTLDLIAESSNQTLSQDLPVAEKLRSLHRFVDRKGNHFRRGTYPAKPPTISTVTRRNIIDPTVSPISRRRLPPSRKLPTPTSTAQVADQGKCELFTNTLCLHDDDYPTDAILQTIRRNKAATGALLADFKNPGDGAVDGVTLDQESKYTAEHYLISNRRGDTANRDFASAGEAGFMCPSIVKYARPQRARATSGNWKYIVNTGEHTQTLRLEKCLKPKEACTYLTDNFKSKCVQVYNYHRLLTWDQQNGLHMDIFKVPTCCSCHIEGYSVSFPPLGHRVQETSSEHFPGEDLSSEQGNHAFESVQSSIQRPSVSKSPPFLHTKPLETLPHFSDNHNLLTATSFSKINYDNDEFITGNIPATLDTGPMDSYGNAYITDSFNQASSVRNVRRPLISKNTVSQSTFDSATLPSYLEPPTPSAPSSFGFVQETQNKYKLGSPFKRGIRPSRRPMRKNTSGSPDDLALAGTSVVQSVETMEDFNADMEEPDFRRTNVSFIPTRRDTIAPKLPAATTEKITTTNKVLDSNYIVKKNTTNGSKKINYNYHPIMDFFGDDEEKEFEEDIDRDDIVSAYAVSSEWKPINLPISRSTPLTNADKRLKN